MIAARLSASVLRAVRALTVLAAFASAAAAQQPAPLDTGPAAIGLRQRLGVGIAGEVWVDPDAFLGGVRGSKFVPAVIYYPRDGSGYVAQPWGAGNSPAIVFLHGTRLAPTGFYRDLGTDLASRGYIVIMPDRHTEVDQALNLMLDGASLSTMLRASPLKDYLGRTSIIDGKFDPERMCVAGHSLGGGAVFPLGSDEPIFGKPVEYACHFAWGPWAGPYVTHWRGHTIARPFGILVGREDTFSGTPPNNFRKDAYDYLANTYRFRGMKFVYEMKVEGEIVEHLSPVYRFGGRLDLAFEHSTDVFSAWIDAMLLGQHDRLSDVVGPRAARNVHTENVAARWRRPMMSWVPDAATVTIYGEPGRVNLWWGTQLAPMPLFGAQGPEYLADPTAIPTPGIPQGSSFVAVKLRLGDRMHLLQASTNTHWPYPRWTTEVVDLTAR